MSRRGVVVVLVGLGLVVGACARPPSPPAPAIESTGHPTADAVRDAAAEALRHGSGGRPFTPLRGRP